MRLLERKMQSAYAFEGPLVERICSLKRFIFFVYYVHRNGSKKDKVAVDGVFFARISKLIKIMIPGIWTKEMFYLLLSSLMMVART